MTLNWRKHPTSLCPPSRGNRLTDRPCFIPLPQNGGLAMRIEQLEYLLVIAKKKSFSSASENLHLTPQSLSRSITSMENELGFKLFERNSQGVRFTPEGQLFLDTAAKIAADYHTALKDIRQYHLCHAPLCAGKLLIYAHPVFTMSILPQAIAAFCKEYPQIKVCLLEEVSRDILENLIENPQADGQTKMGLITIPQASAEMQNRYKHRDNWRFLPLLTGEYICCVSKQSDLASRRQISLKTIQHYPLVRFTNKTGDISDVQSYFFTGGQEPSIGFSTTSIGSWLSAVANDIGIGLIHNIVLSSHSMLKNDFAEVAILSIKEKTTLEAGFLIPRQNIPLIDVFVQFMQDYFQENNLS